MTDHLAQSQKEACVQTTSLLMMMMMMMKTQLMHLLEVLLASRRVTWFAIG